VRRLTRLAQRGCAWRSAIFKGNRSDVTTVEGIITVMEANYGQFA
jgi:hypothetical protein